MLPLGTHHTEMTFIYIYTHTCIHTHTGKTVASPVLEHSPPVRSL